MNAFVIQSSGDKGWDRITTVRFNPNASKSSGDNLCRPDALDEARRQMASWSLYHAFHGVGLRVAEMAV